MKILNLFAGIGGNRSLWGNKHKITSVENNQQIALIYKKRFPNDTVLITDAYEYLLWNYEDFDFIWASPPCRTHSWANNWLHIQGCRRYPDMRLWKLIIFLNKFSKYRNNDFKWIVENVKPYYDPLISPSFIIGRHYFWANFFVPNEGFSFSDISILNAKKTTRREREEYLKDLCDYHKIDKELIDFLKDKSWHNHDLKGQVLRNCVKPEIGKKILDYVLNDIKKKTVDDMKL